MNKYIKEACVENLNQAIRAEKNGADRIELCAHLELDGLSPSVSLVKSVLNHVNIPVRLMVRQRAGNFHYSSQEVIEMMDQIEAYKEYPIEGVVFGLLDAQGNIDIENTALLTNQAFPLKVTFHKAIDDSSDLLKSAEQLTQISGITSILTSGGMATAELGHVMIRNIIDVVSGRMEVIACGKVTSDNLPAIHKLINSTAYHGKRIV